MTGLSKLSYYGQRLKRKQRPFECPVCRIPTSVARFEDHCRSNHGWNPRLCCVWCEGGVSWPAGQKNLNADHLLECSKKFIDSVEKTKSSGGRLSDYRNLLSRGRDSFPCPACPGGGLLTGGVSPGDFEEHCRANHLPDLDPKLCCVWCSGAVRWKAGAKNRHVDHLMQCFRSFVVSCCCSSGETTANNNNDDNNNNNNNNNVVVPRLSNGEPACLPRDFFDRVDLRSSLDPLAFETFRVLDHGRRVEYFRDENLNAAASYVRLFMEIRRETDWIHVMVKAVTFRSFLEVFLAERKLEMLPFSCWCDGGGAEEEEEEARFRQHRHMILVCFPKKRFEKSVWPRVKPSERRENFRSKGMQKIESPMHLVNTLGYLCRRESRCSDFVEASEKVRGATTDKHFYIFESLPADHLLPLSVQWEGGLTEMLRQEKFQNVSVDRLMKSGGGLVFREGRWKQKIKDFYGFESGWVLPLRKGCVPTKEITASFAYLVEGRKLYFTERVCSAANELEEEEEEEETWLKKQVEGGNVFYESVGEEFWIPRKRDQAKLNLAMPLWERNRELESETTRLRDEVTRLKAEVTDLKKAHEEEVIDLKRKHEEEIESLMRDRRRKVNKIEYEKNVKVKLSLDP